MADYKNPIPFIKLREGGLSSATTDTASKNPSSCGIGKNGKPYHTNKGITWVTFSSNAKKLGYEASCSNFINMPDEIWNKIYKYCFWDLIKAGNLKNQAIANFFVEWAWGSGVGGATSGLKKFFLEKYNKKFNNITEIVNFCNNLDKQGQTSKLFEELYVYKKKHYASLNQPANLDGWLNRLDAFYLINKAYSLGMTNTGLIYGIAGLLLMLGGGFYLYKKIKK